MFIKNNFVFSYYILCALFCCCLDSSCGYLRKRQIYRENVSPSNGGKIPESAFHPQRLTLNRLNQNGLYTDGTYLQQTEGGPHSLKPHIPNTLKINHPWRPQLIDTTYIIREPSRIHLNQPILRHNILPHLPYSSLQILRSYKYGTESETETNDIKENIFKKFSAYLEKLHEND